MWRRNVKMNIEIFMYFMYLEIRICHSNFYLFIHIGSKYKIDNILVKLKT